MRGVGIKEERETIIVYNEHDADATITTSSEVVYRRMKKRGWFPSEDHDRRAVFHVPKRTVHLPLNRSRKRVAVGVAAKESQRIE